MRRGIKIKASILLLAWSVIFLHGLIPHNHHDIQACTCHNICHPDHTDNYSYSGEDHSVKEFKNIDHDIHKEGLICHFKTVFTDVPGLSHIFINESSCLYIPVLSVKKIRNCFPVHGILLMSEYDLMPLRAPPST